VGLNYNYLLYFKREHLWDALQGVVMFVETIDPPPTMIQFPDHDLILQITTGLWEENELHDDMPKFDFALSQLIEESEAILDYLLNDGDNRWR
jgi:hypothetical protein